MSSLLLALPLLLSCSSEAPEPPAAAPEPPAAEASPEEAPKTAESPRAQRSAGKVFHEEALPERSAQPALEGLVQGSNAALFKVRLRKGEQLKMPLDGQRAHLLLQEGDGSWSAAEEERSVQAGELLSWPGGRQAELRAGPEGLRGILTLTGEDPPAAEAALQQQVIRELPSAAPPSGAARITHLDRSPSAYLGQLWLKGEGKVPAHRDPTEEYLVLLEGSGTMLLDGEEHALRAGHAIYMPAGAEVSYVNGPQPLLAFQIFAGPESAFKYEAWKTVTP